MGSRHTKCKQSETYKKLHKLTKLVKKNKKELKYIKQALSKNDDHHHCNCCRLDSDHSEICRCSCHNHKHHECQSNGHTHNHVQHQEPCDGVFVFGECKIPFSSTKCNNPFNLRLAGLNENLNFQLFGMKGCRVEIEYECQGTNEKVKGTICNIGTDFIEIKKDSGVISTILKERICKIEWADSSCNPCNCTFHREPAISNI